MGRSFKYHRPRGILSAGSDEPNALVGVGASQDRYTPNLRATQVELYDGLVAESQNRWPSLINDVGAINDALGAIIPAGFYYKTFMWPRGAWDRLYEPNIRAMAAGLGRAPGAPIRTATPTATAIATCWWRAPGRRASRRRSRPPRLARASSSATNRPNSAVALLAEPDATIEGRPAADWLADAVATLSANPRVTVLPRTTAFGYFAHNHIGLVERVTDHLVDAGRRACRASGCGRCEPGRW